MYFCLTAGKTDQTLCSRPTKGRDDSDDEGDSRPKKQRKTKEGRKKFEKVLFKSFCRFVVLVLEIPKRYFCV